MINQEAQLNGSTEAFARAFSNLVKDATSHLATKEDLDNVVANMATKEDLDNAVANMATKEDINELSDRIDTTDKHMQTQFARQEEKIADIARKLD